MHKGNDNKDGFVVTECLLSVKICVSTFPNHLAWEDLNIGRQVRKAEMFSIQCFLRISS